MNIQFSVVIWTVICFLLMMVVLKFLLFKPVLELLDNRKKKIAAAQAKKDEIRLLEEEHGKRLELLAEDAKIQRENLIKSELELIRVKSKQDTEEARAVRLVHTDEYRYKAEKEKDEIKKNFALSSEEIAKTFAERLVSR